MKQLKDQKNRDFNHEELLSQRIIYYFGAQLRTYFLQKEVLQTLIYQSKCKTPVLKRPNVGISLLTFNCIKFYFDINTF